MKINRVLLVEDEKLAQMVGETNLRKLGFEVDVAKSGKEALNFINNTMYCLIFMDIGLPDTDGFELSKKIREISFDKSVPIVALTAHGDNTHRTKAKEHGMDDFYLPIRLSHTVA